MEKCKFIDGENLTKCKHNSKYGNYCYKHRKYHLLDDNENIIIDNFTNQQKDYLIADILIFCMKNKINIDSDKNEKKEFYFEKMKNYINCYQKYNEDLSTIMKLQKKIKFILNQNKHKNCNNEEDFYSFDKLSEIDNKYLYCYRDHNNLKWGFDIRSLIKLLAINKLNPYTTEEIPENIIKDILLKIEILKQDKNFENIVDLNEEKKKSLKQKTVDLFSDIEMNGYSCQIDWFLKLNLRKCKELFKQLEDLWNYRLRDSIDIKRVLSPPDGRLFTTPVIDVVRYENKEDIQDLIINDIYKFKNIQNLSDRKLGYMYFIISLSTVSLSCTIAHQDWLAYV